MSCCVIVCLIQYSLATPVPGRNEVAEFIKSGRMINDYVWVDVTTKKFVPIPGNDLEFGDCSEPNELIYFDNTIIENSGPSTLNGTLEVRTTPRMLVEYF